MRFRLVWGKQCFMCPRQDHLKRIRFTDKSGRPPIIYCPAHAGQALKLARRKT